jgi:hypothetical protein
LPLEPVEVSFETSIPLSEARDRILAALAERNGQDQDQLPYRDLGQAPIKITVRDTLSIGSRGGMIDKYQQVMYEDAMMIRTRFQDVR